MTREVVYDSILTDRRKKLHGEIGQALETLYRDGLGEYCGLLSEHFIKGENYGKGAEYSKKAARKAEKAASLNNAIAYAADRVSCLEKLPQNDELEKQRIDARTTLGLYLIQINYHVEAKEAIDPVIDAAIRHDYKRRLGQIYLILGSYYLLVEEDYSEARRVLEKALKSAVEFQDPINYVLGGYYLGVTYGWQCEFEKSVDCLQQAIDFNMAANNLWGSAAVKSLLGHLYSWFWGKCDLGFKLSKEAVQLAEESGDNYSQGIAYGAHGYSCFSKGYIEEAEKYLLKSVESTERSRQPSWYGATRFVLGDLYGEEANFTKSKYYFEKSFQCLSDARIVPSFANLAKIGLLRSRLMGGERNINPETLFSYSKNNKVKVSEGFYHRWIGEILGNLDGQHLLEAESWINQAIEADIRNGTKFSLGRDYLSYADLLTKKDDRMKAKENLGKAIETFKECGADGWVEKAERKLAEIA